MNRRDVIACLGAWAGVSSIAYHPVHAQAQPASLVTSLQDVWTAWKIAHLDPTGRVVDGPQQNASHSEGQAYGMLLAVAMDDQETFDRIERWTKVTLSIRPDNLIAWRWLPDALERIPDTNNASDGDLLRAWALLQAADKFSVPEYRNLARLIALDLANFCIGNWPGRSNKPMLLPAAHGFSTDDGFIFNPCYSMPAAMADLASAFNMPVLAQAADNAVALSDELSSQGVVPDWLELIEGGWRPARGYSFHCGYEAMRLPLYFIWSGLASHPAVKQYANAQSRTPKGAAATIIERSTGKILATSTEAGYRALAALAVCTTNEVLGSQMPPFAVDDPYYPATLHVLAMIAQFQRSPRCLPI